MYDSKMPNTQTSSGPAIIEVSEQTLQTSAQAMVESVPAIPSSYTLVSEAGEGAYATAYFCLPTQAVTDAISSIKDVPSHSTVIDTLKSKLQVVKVFNDPGRLSRYTEVNILVDIQQHRQSHAQPLPIIEILAWDTTGGVPAWLATSTFPVSCDLEACRGTDMPEEFVWHVYTQLHAALEFLHKSAQVIHRDLHDGNVIVGHSNSTGTGLPQVKVIDFGMAEQLHSNSDISEETYATSIAQCAAIPASRSASRIAGFAISTTLLVRSLQKVLQLRSGLWIGSGSGLDRARWVRSRFARVRLAYAFEMRFLMLRWSGGRRLTVAFRRSWGILRGRRRLLPRRLLFVGVRRRFGTAAQYEECAVEVKGVLSIQRGSNSIAPHAFLELFCSSKRVVWA
jgi:serine/threonine protein kinase